MSEDCSEDFEVLKSHNEIIVEITDYAQKLKNEQEKERESNTLEMQVLLQEMDDVLKDKSDQERNFNAVKRKMERNLMECQEIIENLQRNLAASERAGFKARADLRTQIDKNSETIKERDSLAKKYGEVSALMEEKSIQKVNLEKLLMEERQKNRQNAYLKDYVEFLESEVKQEKQLQERLEQKEKMIQQMNMEHSEIEQSLREINDSLEEENITLRRQLGEKEEERLSEKKARILEREEREDKMKGLEQRLREKEERIKEREESLRKREDEQIKLMGSEATEKKRLREEISRQEQLLKDIDVDTFLTQLENQVDQEYLGKSENGFIDRNTVLRSHLQWTLRGIRQLCDFHQINMEFSI